MADMIADLKHKVGKSMSRLSTNEPHRVPASVARYEGVFQNVLNEVHAPDIAHYVYVLQGDIVVPSGSGRKVMSVPNPLGKAGYVVSAEIIFDAGASSGDPIDVGVRNRADMSSDNLLDGLSTSGTGSRSNLVGANRGTNGSRVQKIGADDFVTVFVVTGGSVDDLGGLEARYSFQFVVA